MVVGVELTECWTASEDDPELRLKVKEEVIGDFVPYFKCQPPMSGMRNMRDLQVESSVSEC